MKKVLLLLGLLIAPVVSHAMVMVFNNPDYVLKTNNRRLEITTEGQNYTCTISEITHGKDQLNRSFIGDIYYCKDSALGVMIKYYQNSTAIDIVFEDAKKHQQLKVDAYSTRDVQYQSSF